MKGGAAPSVKPYSSDMSSKTALSGAPPRATSSKNACNRSWYHSRLPSPSPSGFSSANPRLSTTRKLRSFSFRATKNLQNRLEPFQNPSASSTAIVPRILCGISSSSVRQREILSLGDMIDLFANGQLAICMSNLTNLRDYRAQGLDVFPANFPSMDGRGYAVSTTNGFCVFDNGDPGKIQAAAALIRSIYTDPELMNYTLGTLPVNNSVMGQYGDEIWMLNAYRENSENLTAVVRLDNLNWQGVRNVFYRSIQDLLRGTKTPAQAAAAIDETCNAALPQGRPRRAGA